MTDEFLRRWSRKKTLSNRNIKRKSDAQHEESESVKTFDPTLRSEPLINSGQEAGQANIAASKTDYGSSETENSDEQKADHVPEQYEESDFDSINFDELGFDSDYTQFMQEGVPEAIQRKALRKLWASNPILANIDGLNDYDEDFTDAALAVDVIKSAYKVGSGYLTEEEQVELGMLEQEDSTADDETSEVADLGGQSETTENPGEHNDNQGVEFGNAGENEDPEDSEPDSADQDKDKTA